MLAGNVYALRILWRSVLARFVLMRVDTQNSKGIKYEEETEEKSEGGMSGETTETEVAIGY